MWKGIKHHQCLYLSFLVQTNTSLYQWGVGKIPQPVNGNLEKHQLWIWAGENKAGKSLIWRITAVSWEQRRRDSIQAGFSSSHCPKINISPQPPLAEVQVVIPKKCWWIAQTEKFQLDPETKLPINSLLPTSFPFRPLQFCMFPTPSIFGKWLPSLFLSLPDSSVDAALVSDRFVSSLKITAWEMQREE